MTPPFTVALSPRVKRVVKRHPDEGRTVAEYAEGSSLGIYKGCFPRRRVARAAKRLMDRTPIVVA